MLWYGFLFVLAPSHVVSCNDLPCGAFFCRIFRCFSSAGAGSCVLSMTSSLRFFTVIIPLAWASPAASVSRAPGTRRGSIVVQAMCVRNCCEPTEVRENVNIPHSPAGSLKSSPNQTKRELPQEASSQMGVCPQIGLQTYVACVTVFLSSVYVINIYCLIEVDVSQHAGVHGNFAWGAGCSPQLVETC